MVADFADHYGLRLAEALFEWSPREVLALVEGLPEGGLFHAHVAGGEAWREWVGWGVDRHMLANLYDLTGAAHWQKKPPTHPRPQSKPKSAGVPLMSIVPSRGGRSSL